MSSERLEEPVQLPAAIHAPSIPAGIAKMVMFFALGVVTLYILV